MKATLRHGLYWAASLATIGPILLLEQGAKAANWLDWKMCSFQLWAFRDRRAKARLPAPELSEKWRRP